MNVYYRQYLDSAIEEARKGLEEGGIPIGAVLVKDGEVVARGRNRRVQDDDPVTHAEIDCLRNAGRLGSFRGMTLVSTLMPCYLCSGAAVQFGIGKVVIGESRNIDSEKGFMEGHGIEIVDMDDHRCYEMMGDWIAKNRALWEEDIGD